MKYSVGDSIKYKSKNRNVYYGFIIRRIKKVKTEKASSHPYITTITKAIFINERYLKLNFKEEEIFHTRILLSEKFNEDIPIITFYRND
jgi:hypothetical protein